jgi:hypothetical protein
MPARVLYVGQEVKIQTAPASTGGSNLVRYLPVQQANCEVTRPIEDILSFGRLGSLGRVQNAVTTCKADIKSYLPNVKQGDTSNTGQNLVNAAFLNGLTGEALSGLISVVSVSPNGFNMSGVLSSFSVEISEGSFATADFSFQGVGEPYFASAPTTTSYTQQSSMPASFSPVTSTNVSGQIITGCASSFKFSLEIPTETLHCLGGDISGGQVAVADDFLLVGKPPFKATITVEGTAVDAPTGPQLTNTYMIGKLGIVLPAAQVSSRSFNNAVGQVGATYNYTLDDVSAIFSDI